MGLTFDQVNASICDAITEFQLACQEKGLNNVPELGRAKATLINVIDAMLRSDNLEVVRGFAETAYSQSSSVRARYK